MNEAIIYTPPNSRSQRRVTTAKVPQITGRTSSQTAMEDIHGSRVSQGTIAPIAKDWMSPRPKIAAITNGVGRTQQTLTKNRDPMKSRNDDAIAMTTATAITPVTSHAKLKWKRGSGNQRRAGRVEVVSGSGMMQSTAHEFARAKAVESYHSAGGPPNKGAVAEP
jgi:hypothetical protein